MIGNLLESMFSMAFLSHRTTRNFKLISFTTNATKQKFYLNTNATFGLVITKHWSTIDITHILLTCTICWCNDDGVRLHIAQHCNVKAISSSPFFALSPSLYLYFFLFVFVQQYKMLVFRLVFTTWKHKYFTKCTQFTREAPSNLRTIGHFEVLLAIKMDEREKRNIQIVHIWK